MTNGMLSDRAEPHQVYCRIDDGDVVRRGYRLSQAGALIGCNRLYAEVVRRVSDR